MRTLQQLTIAVQKHNDGRIKAIFHQSSSDARWQEFFDAYLDVHGTWEAHQQKLFQGTSPFWVDNSASASPPERLWKHERFGNYLYGCFISIFFCFSDLPNMKPAQNDAFLKPTVLSRFTHNLFAAFDSFACLDSLVRDSVPRYQNLRNVYFQGVQSPYAEAVSHLSDTDYLYMKVLRDLLTHRPFWQFMIDGSGNHYLPQDPHILDSITQRNKSYMTRTLGDFGEEVFEKSIKMLTASLRRLNTQYAPKT